MASIGETLTLNGKIKTGYAPGVEQWTVGSGQQVKILNTRSQGGQQYYDIQHIGGGTGWVSASALESALKASAPAPSKISSTTQANKITSSVKPATVANQQANVLASMGNTVNKATQSLSTAIADQQKLVNQDIASKTKERTDALNQVKELTTPFRQDTETAGREKYGTDQILEDQRALITELDQLLTEGNNLVRQQQEVTGLSAIRNPRIQQTMDDVAARAGVIEAVLNAQNGYLSNAYYAIDRTISAIAGDRQDRIAYYDSIISMADRDIVNLTAEKRQLAEEQIDILRLNLNEGIKSANYIKELMTDPSTATMMAKAGIKLNDSVDQINAKLSKYQVSEEIRLETNKFLSAGASIVSDPSSVPAHLLASYTDPNGKTHYFRYSEKPKTVTPDPMEDFQNWLTTTDFMNDSLTDFAYEQPTTASGMPNFTPSRPGQIYIDPSTGDMWQSADSQYASGWTKIN